MKQKTSVYDHNKIEKKWQKEWEKKRVFKTSSATKKPKKYVLDMFPYPSGAGLHVGHPRGYIANDVYARLMRIKGFNVLHPMGYDAFGLPAEQYAIANKIHPRKAVEKNVETFRKQLEKIGFSYDWSRTVNTTDPKYYKWTQWIFLKLFGAWYNKDKNKAEPIETLVKIFEKSGNEKMNAVCDSDIQNFSAKEWKVMSEIEQQKILMKYRLAYEGVSSVNWCPELGTVLANDEIVDGPSGMPVSERGGYPVVKKSLRQWFLRITAYADRLVEDLSDLDWSSHIKEIQKNWIGKSEGSEIEFAIKGREEKIKVFTTRADTLFGVTYVVLAPEHELVQKLISDVSNKKEVEKYITEIKNKTEEDRVAAGKDKTGIELKGVIAINPANGEEVPVWIADYVLVSYGTGMVMAVPAHDDRDFAFAKKYNLPIKEVVIPERIDKRNPPVPGKQKQERQNVQAIVKDVKTGKYLCLHSKKHHWNTFPMGGVNEGENLIEAAKREVLEETGYKNLINAKILGGKVRAEYFAKHKDQNRVSFTSLVYFELGSEERDLISEEEKEENEILWIEKEKLNTTFMCHAEMDVWLERLENEIRSYNDDGVLTNSAFVPSSVSGVGILLETSDGEFVFQLRDMNTNRNPGMVAPFGGAVEKGENPIDAVIREVWEELNIKISKEQISFIETVPSKNTPGQFIAMFRVEIGKVPEKTNEGAGIAVLNLKQVLVSDKVTDFTKDVLNLYVKKGSSKIVFDELSSEEARKEITKAVGGKIVTKYKMRDAVFARQRYWGEPIPLVHKDGMIKPLKEKELPLTLPNVKSYEPIGTGESPLAGVKEWVKNGYETNTMPGWAGSSWYFLRYMDPQNNSKFASEKALKYWKQVDMYVGGAEHATGHLLYSRFWHKFLFDMKLVPTKEPFKSLRNQGMILGTDNRKMSKRWGNVVNPDDVVKTFGADTLRVFEMFIGPFDSQLPWSTDGIVGSRRFIERVWRLQEKLSEDKKAEYSYEQTLHKTIKKVGEDIESFNFNTAISAMMILVNEMEKSRAVHKKHFEKLLQILSPFAPHMTEELWKTLGNTKMLHEAGWPKFDHKKLVSDMVTIGVQVNGKVRGEVKISKDNTEAEVLEMAKANDSIAKWLEGNTIVKVIFVPGRLINIVVKS